MGATQQLGGTRQSSPLDDEMAYPLTKDEYLLIKENLIIDRLTNWESFLLTTGITTFISGVIICCTGSFENHLIVDSKEIITLNITQLIIIIIYGVFAFGSFIGFFIARSSKKKSEKPIQRLDAKIMSHINKKDE